MNRHAGVLTVIIVGIVAVTPVWADIPTGAFDLPTATSVKKPGERTNRSSKPRHRNPSPIKHSSRQHTPHKGIVAKQAEQKKAELIKPLADTPEKPVLARASAAYNHYLPKFKQNINSTWGAVKQKGMVVQSATLKAWQGVKLWMESRKENLHVSQP